MIILSSIDAASNGTTINGTSNGTTINGTAYKKLSTRKTDWLVD